MTSGSKIITRSYTLSKEDLARAAVCDRDDERRALLSDVVGKIINVGFSYRPVKKHIPTIFKFPLELFDAPALQSEASIIAAVMASCRKGKNATLDQRKNTEVAKALLSLAKGGVTGKAASLEPSWRPMGKSLKYWLDAVLHDGNMHFFPIFDMRVKNGVYGSAGHFAASLAWANLMESYPERRGMCVTIVSFGQRSDKTRFIRPLQVFDRPSFSRDEIEERVRKVENVWAELMLENKYERKRA